MPDLEKLIGLTITDIDVHKGAEDGTGFVYLNAIGADETPDIDDEIFDYKTSKPFVETWSEASADSTKSAGQAVSYGNVRAQHGAAGAQNAAGTICEPIVYDDKEKRISLRIKVVDADAITKVQEGVYRGVSIKGRLVGKKWRDGKYYRYTVDPVEFSLVDKPANPNATITVVKADGTTEVLKVADEKHTKRVGGKDLGPESFAYVGDKSKTETWKLPIHDASHVRNALARFNQTEGIPEESKAKVEAKIRRAAKRFGVDAESMRKSAASSELSEGARQIGALLDGYFYLRDTTVLEADQVVDILKTAVVIIEENTEEVEDTILMEEVNKNAKSEEIEKASAISRMKAARKAHDENSACLSGYCGHGDVEKCMEKVAENHKAIEAAFRDDKVKKSADAEKAAKKKPEEDDEEETENDGDADDEKGEKKAKKSAKKEDGEEKDAKDGDAEKSATIKALEEQVAKLTETVEKMAGEKSGKRPVPVHPGTKVVSKSDESEAELKDVVEKMNAVKADDPERIDKIYRIQREAEPELVKL